MADCNASRAEMQAGAVAHDQSMTGSEALAWGVLDARVQFVTGYPGSPSTAAVEALIRLDSARRAPGDVARVRVEWAINEKSATDAALGMSLAGGRTLVCMKNVGLNVALDALMVANLAPGDGALVMLVGDDPGGWGSQNEEDSRPLIAAAEVPALEPATVGEARLAIRAAFELSERVQVPVVVRVVRALTEDRGPAPREHAQQLPPIRSLAVRREPDRWTVLPIQVVDLHRKLQTKLAAVRDEFEVSPLNWEEGEGTIGIVAAGQVYWKLAQALEQVGRPALRVLKLGTIYPLPERRIARFMRGLERVLVLEETAPLVETAVQAIAQRAGLAVPIYGRASGHVPGAGELFAADIVAAVSRLAPDWTPGGPANMAGRARISRQEPCQGCPYVPAVEALLAVMGRHGGRDAFFVTCETGCLVRTHLPPWRMLDAKYSMGSSIGVAAGLARAGVRQRLVALSGDSAFLHDGLGELIDTVRAGVRVMVVIFDNGTTALSGGQPHPGTRHDALGRKRRPVDLVRLIQAAGVDQVWAVDPVDSGATEAALEGALASDGVSVVVVRRPCPIWAS